MEGSETMNSTQLRQLGYATIFRRGHVFILGRTHLRDIVRIARVDQGRWMEIDPCTLPLTALDALPDDLQVDLRATREHCYCDQGVDLCDFCGQVRPVADGVSKHD
jgi:hypothetical protein